jgi:hypothetical protein
MVFRRMRPLNGDLFKSKIPAVALKTSKIRPFFQMKLRGESVTIRQEPDAFVLACVGVLKFSDRGVYSFFSENRTFLNVVAYLADRFAVPWMKSLF